MGIENKTGRRGQGAGSGKDRRKTGATAIFYITDKGHKLAQRISEIYPDARIVKFTSVEANGRSLLQRYWSECRNLIFIMATGIVVRAVAPLLKDKKTDPAVVVLDEKVSHVVSLLSGHLGGANALAKDIAAHLGGEAVITTASDVNNLPSIDLWAQENNLVIENWRLLPRVSTRLLNKGSVNIYIEQNTGVVLPDEFIKVEELKLADIVITNNNSKFIPKKSGQNLKFYLRPRNLIIGIGCNSGTPVDEIEEAVGHALDKHGLSFSSIHSIATIDKKKNEPGLVAFAKKYNLQINTFSPEELNSAVSRQPSAVSRSKTVFKATGAYAVAEPAAMLAAGTKKLLVPKQKSGNVTVAVAEKKSEVRSQKSEDKSEISSSLFTRHSSLYIVGTGPGGAEYITPRAQEAIRKSDVIVGYGTYLDLITDLIKDKEVVSTGMTQEVDRCRKAVELALSGKSVSIISGGDPGIYAMAGLVFEILKGTGDRGQGTGYRNPDPVVEVIPGISALNACAARLGAPLMHDFVSISLSNRLTPWEVIEKRLEAAAKADFVIVLYNPKSKGRQKHIQRAHEIISGYRKPDTPVGIVKAAMRENENIVITNLKDMLAHDIDMQTTVIIGNSQTVIWNNYLITPRGYERKFKI